MRIIVGITGASGAIYGLRLLEVLQQQGCETHVVISNNGWDVLAYECGVGRAEILQRAATLHEVNHIGAAIASGSFRTDGMVIAPCSMRSLASVANGMADNLLCRAADVTIKEGRKLIIVPRETPFSAIHLGNMLRLTQAGVCILPACPGFYHRPVDLQGLVDMVVGKICDQLGVEHDLFARWTGD